MIDPKTIAMLRELEAKATPAPWANRYHRKHVTTADWKHYLPILAECSTFENGDFIAEARNHLTALLDEIERLQAALKTAHEELLRVRTRGHGAAHELDNIAVEAGLGANPQPVAEPSYRISKGDRDLILDYIALWRSWGMPYARMLNLRTRLLQAPEAAK